MEIREALTDWLESSTGLMALVDHRIYPIILPQEPTYPALTFTCNNDQRIKSFCGTSKLLNTGVEINAWALTLNEAEEVAAIVRALLVDFSGTWGGSPGIQISDVDLVNDFDLSEIEPGLYRRVMNFNIWHTGE